MSYSDAVPDAAVTADAATIAQLQTVIADLNRAGVTALTNSTPNSYWIQHYQDELLQAYDDFQAQEMQRQMDYATKELHETGPALDVAEATPRLQDWINKATTDKTLP